MVLQRDCPIKLWGTADPNESITVQLLNHTYQTKADENGNWLITLPAHNYGGPYTLQINDINLNDILIGDVFLCSGQSNMELPVNRVTDMFQSEINDYENTYIRHIKVPNAYNFHAPQADITTATWASATQPDVMNYSALAYFFAKALYNKTNIPVGIINSDRKSVV